MKFLQLFLLIVLLGLSRAGPTPRRQFIQNTDVESEEDSSEGNEVQDDEPSLEEQDLIIEQHVPKSQRGWAPGQETVSNNNLGSNSRPSLRDDEDSEEEDEESFDDFNPEDVVDSDVEKSPSFPVSTWPEASYGTRNGLSGLRSIFRYLPFNVRPARIRPSPQELHPSQQSGPNARFYQEEMPVPIFLSGF